MVYLLHFLKINKKSKLCGKAIIEDLQEAGWSMKKPRENEKISDLDLRHIFDKVLEKKKRHKRWINCSNL